MTEPQSSGGGKKRNRNKKNKNKNKNPTLDGAQTSGESNSPPIEKTIPEGPQKPPVQETKPATTNPVIAHNDTQNNGAKAQKINEDDLLKCLLLEARYNNYMTSMAQIADAERVYYTNLQNKVRIIERISPLQINYHFTFCVVLIYPD